MRFPPSTCAAVRQSDEMFCAKCNNRWPIVEGSLCTSRGKKRFVGPGRLGFEKFVKEKGWK